MNPKGTQFPRACCSQKDLRSLPGLTPRPRRPGCPHPVLQPRGSAPGHAGLPLPLQTQKGSVFHQTEKPFSRRLGPTCEGGRSHLRGHLAGDFREQISGKVGLRSLPARQPGSPGREHVLSAGRGGRSRGAQGNSQHPAQGLRSVAWCFATFFFFFTKPSLTFVERSLVFQALW